MSSMFIQVLLLILGFIMLIKGADFFVDGAAGIASKAGLSQLVIGLTIVAMGTSAPEAAVSISSALKGNPDISIGNVVGSNIVNILLILGVTALIIPLAVRRSTRRYEMPFVVLVTIVLAFLGLTDNEISRIDALILLLLFVVYFIYLFRISKTGDAPAEDEPTKQRAVPLLLLMTAVGVVCIVLGSDIAVDAATEIATALGLSTRVIGLTIVAIGTSLPELVTCIIAAHKKNADIAIGNIVGSNIFNILFIIGITGMITPVPYQSSFFIDSIICIGAALLLLLLCLNKQKKLLRWGGLILLLCYAGYFVYLLK